MKLTGSEKFSLSVPLCSDGARDVEDLIAKGILSVDGQPEFVLESEANVRVPALDDFIIMFNEVMYRKFTGTHKNSGQFNARIKDGLTLSDMERATKAAKQDEFHRSNRFKYVTPEYMLRADILQRYLNMDVEPEKKSMFDGEAGS